MLNLVLASALAVTPAARATDVGVVVTGEATLQPQLAASLEHWLADHGRNVVPSPLQPETVNQLIDCFVLEDLGCARKIVDLHSKSRAIVFARVEVTPQSDGTRDVSISGYWVEKGHETLAEKRVCEHCNDQKLRDTAEGVMILLSADPPVSATKIEITHIHGGGMAAEGHENPRTLPMGLMAGGGLALAVGAIMIAIDQDPDPHGVQMPTYRDTAPAGAVLAIGGAAAIGVGAYLWFHQGSHAAPVAAVSHDGAYVGWAGRF